MTKEKFVKVYVAYVQYNEFTVIKTYFPLYYQGFKNMFNFCYFLSSLQSKLKAK